jgi:hypothetical protein
MGEAYNKTEAQALGVALFETVTAVKDGIQPEDAATAMSLLMKLSAAANEIQVDRDAAILDIVSGLTSKLADSRRDDLALPPGQ